MSTDGLQSLLILLAVCLNLTALTLASRDRDRRERSGQAARPAPLTNTPTGRTLVVLSAVCLLSAGVLHLV